MDARHRIGIIATAVAAIALTGGQATASIPLPPPPTPSQPDTDIGRAVYQCVDGGDSVDGNYYDNGHSLLADSGYSCVLRALGLPEWVTHTRFDGILKFGDWSVMIDERSTADDIDMWILDNEVAPDN